MAPIRTPDGTQIDYDATADVIHMTFVESAEPSYGYNVDDVIIVLRGLITDVMLGLEVLDARRHGLDKIQEILLPVIQEEKQRVEQKTRDFQSKIDELQRKNLEDLVPA